MAIPVLPRLIEKEQSVARDKVVLAYSGGLDTSVAVKWINETYNMDVIAYTCDLGQGQDIEAIRQKALRTGAVDAIAEDARNLFIDYFVFPSLAAGALYEGKYPLATALGRPLIAQLMVRVARDHGAAAVAHGCTGKGNDQVRFDVTFQTLAPDLKIIAPVREWKWTRTQELEFAAKHGIEVEATKKSIFSTDQNLWGRSIEAGILEDPWVEPPPETFQWTTDPRLAPDEPEEVEITFDRGKPVALDGREQRRRRADRRAEPARRQARRRPDRPHRESPGRASSRARSTRPRPPSCSTRPTASSSSSRSPRSRSGSRRWSARPMPT